jgi:cell division protein FtsW
MTTINVIRKKGYRIHPRLAFHFDYWLLLAAAGLIIIGLLTVYSTTFDLGRTLYEGDSGHYIRIQLLALAIGLVCFLFIMAFDYHILRRFSVVIFLVAIAGLILTLFIGEDLNGARRGLLGGSVQPSEVAKLATIIYTAHWLSSKGDRIKMANYGLVPFSIIVGGVCGLIVRQPDLSTAILIFVISFALFFIAGADVKQFILAGIISTAVFALLVVVLPHAAARWDAYLIALKDPLDAGYQIELTLEALARGGLFGVGPGASIQKFIPLPAAHTDGAFAILAEEYGLVGAVSVIGLLAVLIWRGFRAATHAQDNYGALLAIGITCWLGFQALINIAVVTAVIPFTGMALPFISYGGSAFTISIIGVAVLLNISRDAALVKRPQPQSKPTQ